MEGSREGYGMKNQYFGDINDYRKYGLLRCLANQNHRIFVHWMLTPDDSGTDGNKVHYILDASTWRKFDPELFDSLSNAVCKNQGRMVSKAAEWGLIPNANYFDKLIPNDKEERRCLMKQGLVESQGADLVFFDPDNGMQVKSKPYGVKGSNKYLYWEELDQYWKTGVSVMVYQHFPRKNRKEFLNELSEILSQRYQPKYIVLYVTNSVVFFLLAQKKHADDLEATSLHLEDKWTGQIYVIRLNLPAVIHR